MLTWLSRIFFVAGIVLLGVSAYLYWDREMPPATVDPLEIVVNDAEPDGTREVVVEIRNLSRHPIRVVGIGLC
jgi:hypothetical protein